MSKFDDIDRKATDFDDLEDFDNDVDFDDLDNEKSDDIKMEELLQDAGEDLEPKTNDSLESFDDDDEDFDDEEEFDDEDFDDEDEGDVELVDKSDKEPTTKSDEEPTTKSDKEPTTKSDEDTFDEEEGEELESSNIFESSKSNLEEEPDDDDLDEETLLKDVDDTGTEVDIEEEGLGEKESEDKIVGESDFIDSSGGIVVQEKDDDGHGFTFAYINKDNIAVQTDSRIHKDSSALTALQKSIQNTGILEPLVVAPLKTEGYYILIHGFRRFQAGLRGGLKEFPCIINNRIKTNEIPIIEAIYNHTKSYNMIELKQYITYLEQDKGILSASMIEFLCQLNSGDYAKLRDLWDDNDPDIIEKLNSGQFTIQQAFNALEKRRKKESKAEQESKAAEKAYSGGDSALLDEVAASGDVGDKDGGLTEEEIKEMSFDPTKLDEIVEEKNLDDMVEDGKEMEGFEPHKQDPEKRERIDPSIRKAVMSRDNNTCQCCYRGGPDYVDILDLHHIIEVYLGGEDSVENSIALCLNCHKQVHLYAFNKLHIPKTKTDDELKSEAEQLIAAENAKRKEEHKEELTDAEKDEIREEHNLIYKNEQKKYKKILYLGNIIREGMRKKGMRLEQAKKDHPIDNIGRQKPGIKNTIA